MARIFKFLGILATSEIYNYSYNILHLITVDLHLLVRPQSSKMKNAQDRRRSRVHRRRCASGCYATVKSLTQ